MAPIIIWVAIGRYSSVVQNATAGHVPYAGDA
jgi:hypothetical protein